MVSSLCGERKKFPNRTRLEVDGFSELGKVMLIIP
jgi:hypothetical protein